MNRPEPGVHKFRAVLFVLPYCHVIAIVLFVSYFDLADWNPVPEMFHSSVRVMLSDPAPAAAVIQHPCNREVFMVSSLLILFFTLNPRSSIFHLQFVFSFPPEMYSLPRRSPIDKPSDDGTRPGGPAREMGMKIT
jgi:hypothetical protein